MGVPEHAIPAQAWTTGPLGALPHDPPAAGPAAQVGEATPEPAPATNPGGGRPAPDPLPVPLTPLVGRTAEVAAVTTAVPGCRLVTLTGTGGTGKTRVALQAAAELADRFPDGTAFADLAPVSDPELVAVTLEQQLRVPPLRLPDHDGQAASSEAVQLFVQRARALDPGFDPQGETLAATAAICSALDGLPLAIELAAPGSGCTRRRPCCPSCRHGCRC
jgi:hypothetical protein